MKSLFNRWCGHTTELADLKALVQRHQDESADLNSRLQRSRILREDAERRLLEIKTELSRTRKQRDDLTELVQDQVDRDAVIDLLIHAKRSSGLPNSGPKITRDRIDQAITLLRVGKETVLNEESMWPIIIRQEENFTHIRVGNQTLNLFPHELEPFALALLAHARKEKP